MNKRSALFVAGGLVVTMLIAASAILMGVTGPSSAHANVVPRHHKQKAVVKTIKRTVTVHEPAPAPSTSTNVTSTTTAGSIGAQDDRSGGSHEGSGGMNPPPSPMPGSGGWGEDDGSPSGSPSPSGGPSWGGDD